MMRFSGASQKLSLILSDSVNTAEVHCLGKVEREEFELVKSYFGIVLYQEDAFTGSIRLPDSSNWDFIIYNANNSNATADIYGFISNGGRKIDIHAIRKMEGQNTFLSSLGVYGYELKEKEQMLGAVETMNKGRVFLPRTENSLDQLLAASLSAALLLKTDLEAQQN